MNINKNSLLKSSVYSLIILVFFILYFFLRYEKIYDNTFSVILYFMIVTAFVGSLYWTYKQIEYYKLKYKDEKRPWYSWLWWPLRSLEEVFYWRATFFVTLFFPSLVFICLVYVLGYSLLIGLIFATVLFLIIIFSFTEISIWQNNSNQKNNEKQFSFRKYNKRVILTLVIIFIIMIIFLPYLEKTKGNYMEQKYIGTWENPEISFEINENYTCTASYKNSSYNGKWELIKGLGYIQITWYQRFKLPHPNDNSYLYTIEQVFLINDGNSLSLYTPFSAPDYLTLDKI